MFENSESHSGPSTQDNGCASEKSTDLRAMTTRFPQQHDSWGDALRDAGIALFRVVFNFCMYNAVIRSYDLAGGMATRIRYEPI